MFFLLPAYICALQREVPYHGRLYITDTHACFYSSVLLKETKVVRSHYVLFHVCLKGFLSLFLCLDSAGGGSSFLHPHSEEAEHGFAGTQRPVDPHHRRTQGQTSIKHSLRLLRLALS